MNTKFKETNIGLIPEEWEILSVAEIARVNEKVVSAKDGINSIEYLDTASVDRGIISNFQSLSFAEAPSRARRILKDGDTIVSTVRPNLKHFAFIKNAQKNWIGSTGFAVVTPKKIEPSFLYYSLTTDSVTEYLSSIAASQTSTYPAFNPDVIEEMLIAVPPEIEQRKISQILSSLDDKIVLNRQINANLEKMASALFKRWFVDFEFPDENGKPYKSSGGKMVESEMGEIPEGWRAGKINDLVRVESGFPFNSSMFDDSGRYELVTIKNVQDGFFVSECTDRLMELPPKMPEHCKLKSGDILLSLTGNVGRVCIVYGEKYLLNQRVATLIPVEEINRAFTYALFRRDEFQNNLINISRGTAQQNLSPIETKNLDLVVPTKEVLAKFGDVMNSAFKAMVYNLDEIKSFSTIRDSLLPRLMSGRIRT